MLLAGQAMQDGTFTVGDFALFIAYLGHLGALPSHLGGIITQRNRASVSLKRLLALQQGMSEQAPFSHQPIYLKGTPPGIPHEPKTDAHRLNTLDISRLSYHYPGSDQGIQDVSLHIQRGSFTVIAGRVGAGKTTLLRDLTGVLPKEDGEIRWNGEIVDQSDTFFIPPGCAYTPQITRLFSASMRDNILMGSREDSVDLQEALYAAVLEPDIATLENGLDTIIGPRGVKLSGGQVLCTAAARMFVRNPESLVIDDLSSALYVETEQKLWERLALRHESTCLVVSHRRTAFRHAVHIIVLKNGRIEAEGILDDLLNLCKEMQHIWHGRGTGLAE